MSERVQIKNVKWDHYPRSEHSQQQVDLYRSAIDNLPPILVNKNGFGIDGYHRCQAFRQEGETEIEAEVLDIPDDQVLVEAIRRNATHGLQLTSADKRRLGAQLYPDLDIDEIAELLSVHRNSVLSWTKDKREEERKEEDRIIWQMWLACATQEEIAGAVGMTDRGVADRIRNLHKSVETSVPDPLKMYNIWQFQSCDPDLGIDYPGRIPGQIVEHLLYYYTEPFDVVWDLFGGGGVTVDACKRHARRYRVFDIDPIRDDMLQHDATDGMPKLQPKPNLIFLDPPYWKQKQGDYGNEPTNLANFDADNFHETLATIIQQAREIAEYVAVIISPTQYDWTFQDHAAEIMASVGVPHHRISVPYSTEIHGGNYVKMAKENKQWLYLNRDLLIYRGTKIVEKG